MSFGAFEMGPNNDKYMGAAPDFRLIIGIDVDTEAAAMAAYQPHIEAQQKRAAEQQIVLDQIAAKTAEHLGHIAVA